MKLSGAVCSGGGVPCLVIKLCPDLRERAKRMSFKRNLKVAGRDSYCAVRRVITPVRFATRNADQDLPDHAGESPGSGPGMGLLVAAPEPLHGHVGVDLGGGEAAVAQYFLDRTKVRAAIEQVRCRGMPQGVRAGG